VVLCCAVGVICNGHPASVVVKNQRLPNTKISNFSVPSSFEPGGREFESLRAHFCIQGTRTLYRFLTLNVVIRTPGAEGPRGFDNLAVFGQVGRRRAKRGGGPERSGGRAASAASNPSGRTTVFRARVYRGSAESEERFEPPTESILTRINCGAV